MNNLDIIANKITPAKVEFNFKEIEIRLDEVLDKYKGLVFTEETVSDCKKTMADLRKGQKSLDDFRKDTKKKLTESVTLFENDCKYLYNKFNEVIDPLKAQADYYEEQRREDKGIEVKGIIDNLVQQYELQENYSKELVVQDRFLIASISIKKVTEELEHQARLLKDNQDQEELDIEMIKQIIEQRNKEDELNIIPDSYIRLLEYMDASGVVLRLLGDIDALLKTREQERLRLAEQEKQRIVRETELENQRIAQEQEDKRIEEMEDIEISGIEENIEEDTTFNIMDFEELPKEVPGITKTYKVFGNAEQIKDLETFLNAVIPEWEVL